jgi:vanillate monooxygenase ferredoxin subunit
MTRLVRVARKWQEAERIFGFELEDPCGGVLPSFEPGAHIDVHMPGAIIRQYSLCNLASQGGRYHIAVQREINSRGGSATLCASVHEGHLLEISDPRNHFRLVPAESTVLLAGGIGITPLISMAEHLADVGASFELHYCTQARTRTAFHERIAAAKYRTNTFFHFEDGDDSQKLDIDAVLLNPRTSRHVYVCGPPGFLGFVRDRARQYAWASENVHFEYFSTPSTDVHEETSSFEVVSARSGRSVVVGKEESVVDALARIGIDIPRSCEVGVCGTCLTMVVEGMPDHRDCFLSDEERAVNTQFLPCCSRSKSPRLVLDV